MAITNISEWLAGRQMGHWFSKRHVNAEGLGVPVSMWTATGQPGAASTPSAGLAGETLSAGATGRGVAGQLIFPDPGDLDCYLGRGFVAQTGAHSSIIVADRLWQNSGVVPTTTTAQTVNSVAFPARDDNGEVDGVGVQVALEIYVATTNAGAVTTITMSYTNTAGTASRTATIPTFPATAIAGSFVPFDLQSGDHGVKSIQSVTLGTTLGGGTIGLVAFRSFGRGSGWGVSGGGPGDITPYRGAMTRTWPNTVPFIYGVPGSTGMTVNGKLGFVHG